MSAAGRWSELVVGPFRASWRAALGWAVAFVLVIVGTVAFWPAFKDSTGLDEHAPDLLAVVAHGCAHDATVAGGCQGSAASSRPR